MLHTPYIDQNIHITEINDALFHQKELCVGILRLDLLHPIVSGNKIFKISPYLEMAGEKGIKTVITMGGAFSNHLHAFAFAAREKGLKAIGILKGDQPKQLTITLQECIDMGMDIRFIENKDFDQWDERKIREKFPDAIFVPQGGYGSPGMMGAAEIMKIKGVSDYDFIIAACGTGTMGAGLIIGGRSGQEIILISVLKNNISISEEIGALIADNSYQTNYTIEHRFHLGGYAKKSIELFDSMNKFYSKFSIPTDFVYTGKMVYAFEKLVNEDRFPKNARILLIHSGGLQGNRSIESGCIHFEIKDYLCGQ
jgi:1-aminocyclopropane-1-carboxylate deaminase/D-cysteine desulfhydrase-like pyridoxal-dependent ACC family enzyme